MAVPSSDISLLNHVRTTFWGGVTTSLASLVKLANQNGDNYYPNLMQFANSAPSFSCDMPNTIPHRDEFYTYYIVGTACWRVHITTTNPENFIIGNANGDVFVQNTYSYQYTSTTFDTYGGNGYFTVLSKYGASGTITITYLHSDGSIHYQYGNYSG